MVEVLERLRDYSTGAAEERKNRIKSRVLEQVVNLCWGETVILGEKKGPDREKFRKQLDKRWKRSICKSGLWSEQIGSLRETLKRGQNVVEMMRIQFPKSEWDLEGIGNIVLPNLSHYSGLVRRTVGAIVAARAHPYGTTICGVSAEDLHIRLEEEGKVICEELDIGNPARESRRPIVMEEVVEKILTGNVQLPNPSPAY